MRPRRSSVPALFTGIACALATFTAQPAAAAVTSCGTGPVTPANTAAFEAFFTDATVTGTTAPGQLTACREIALSDGDLPAGTRGFQVIYRSVGAEGQATAVSGTILVPQGDARGIISLASGTTGLSDRLPSGTASCAPSVGIPGGGAVVSPAIGGFLARGYAVAVTDYVGLRTPGYHPYLHGPSEGKAMIDMARAARNLPGAGLGSKHVLVTGYSQGGHSAHWAAYLAKSYGAGVPIIGAVAGAAPVDLEETRQNLDGALASGIYAYMITSFANQQPALGLLGKLDSSGSTFVSSLAPKCSLAMVATVSGWFRSWGNLWKLWQNPLGSSAFNAALDANDVPTARPQIPIFMFHGVDDGVIPIGPHQALAQGWQTDPGRTVDVVWAPVAGSHIWSSNANGQDVASDWVDALFDDAA